MQKSYQFGFLEWTKLTIGLMIIVVIPSVLLFMRVTSSHTLKCGAS